MSWRDLNGAIGSLGAHVRDRSAPPRGSRGNETPTHFSGGVFLSGGRRRLGSRSHRLDLRQLLAERTGGHLQVVVVL